MPEARPEDGPATLEALSRVECLNLLSQARVGRVGVSVGALPVILPVNYALFDGCILFRTAVGTKLAAATNGAVVAFESDGYNDDGSAGWSVLVVGPASRLSETGRLSRARGTGLRAWAEGEAAEHFVVIELGQVTGRRFGRRAVPNGA